MIWFNKNQFSRVNKFGTAVERIGRGFRRADRLTHLKNDISEDRSHDGSHSNQALIKMRRI
jgi:hypothetical protein